MSSGTIMHRVAEWAAGATPASLPRRVSEEAKNQVLGMIAAVHAGHFSDSGRIISRTVKEWAGNKEATLLPSGERASVHAAIAGNIALGLALDYDDYLFGARTGATAVLASLAMAEKVGAGGPEFLLAQVLANEVGGRLGLATTIAVPEAALAVYVHQAAAAVIAASMLKLDAGQTEHALSLALAQAAPLAPAAAYGSEARVLATALAAPVGVQAAELAANGVRTAHDALEGDGGLFRRLGAPPLLGAFSGLGAQWLTESLGYKIYPGSPYLATIIDCVLGLVRQHHVDARKVYAIHVGAGPHALAMNGAESLPVTLTQSVAYPVAAAVIERELSPRQFGRDRISNAAIWELAGKVRLSLDEDLARKARDRSALRVVGDDGASAQLFDLGACDLNAFKATVGSRVRIELEGGRTFDMEQDVPIGSGARPFDDRRKAVEDKFRRETRYTLRKERMEKAIDIVHHLEDANAAQIRELARLCCSEKG